MQPIDLQRAQCTGNLRAPPTGSCFSDIADVFRESGEPVLVVPYSPRSRALIEGYLNHPDASADIDYGFEFGCPTGLSAFSREGRASLEIRGEAAPTEVLEAIDKLVEDLVLLVREISGARSMNAFVLTNSASELSWHRHASTQIYAALTIHADWEGPGGGTLFAPDCVKNFRTNDRPGEEELGRVIATNTWEIGLFKGDALHSSPDSQKRRTLLRVCSL